MLNISTYRILTSWSQCAMLGGRRLPVLKRDGSVRVCGNYKVTINKSLRKEVYPLPTPHDLFTKLEGRVRFAMFLDDVIVTDKTQVEYENNLLEVLTRLSDTGLTLKEAKCEFGMSEVQYLGYQVWSYGLEPLAECIQPVMNAPALTCVSELKSYLGMLTYYNQFLPNVSTELEPLHELLRTGMEWEWTTECDRKEYEGNA